MTAGDSTARSHHSLMPALWSWSGGGRRPTELLTGLCDLDLVAIVPPHVALFFLLVVSYIWNLRSIGCAVHPDSTILRPSCPRIHL